MMDGYLQQVNTLIFLKRKYQIIRNLNFLLPCVNGTAALQIALKLVGVRYDDEVIAPTLTFIAPINAISYCNAKPVFMDCDNYYNIDTGKITNFINQETVFKNGFTLKKNKQKNKGNRFCSCMGKCMYF